MDQIVQLLELDLRRSPTQIRALVRLHCLAGADGVAVLRGGVRGWAEELGCSLGYPRQLLAELESAGLIGGLDIYPARGGRVAEVHIDPKRSMIESPDTPPAVTDPPPHQDAEPRSMIESPPHPPMWNHDLKQQQQCAEPESDTPAGSDGADRWVAWALRTFPNDPALVRAIFSHPEANFEAARNLFAARPDLNLAQWKAEIAKASDLEHIQRPWGLVVSQLTVGRQIAPRRSRQSSRSGRADRAARRDAPSPADWAAMNQAEQAARQAEQAARQAEPDAVPQLAEPPDLLALARSLLDGQASGDDEAFLVARVAAGDDAREAVRALWQRRAELLAQERARHDDAIAAVGSLVGGSLNVAERDIVSRRLRDADRPEDIAAAIRSRRARPPRGRAQPYDRLLPGGG